MMLKFTCKNLPSKSSKSHVPNWPGFWDQYDSAIRQKQSITHIDKFTCLKSHLCDLVNSVVPGLTLTSENYKEAMDLLRKRCANPQNCNQCTYEEI